jgi:hypothetical protein
VSKSKANSPQKNVLSNEKLLELIDEVVETEGALSVRALASAVRDKGMVMSDKGFDSKLRSLTARGLLVTEQRPQTTKSSRVVRFIVGRASGSH